MAAVLFFPLYLCGQLSVEHSSPFGAAAGTELWNEEQGLLHRTLPETSSFGIFHRVNSLRPEADWMTSVGTTESPTSPAFDFTRTVPHLAFFCRLEINEKVGHAIPLKFRLGGHQPWQDALERR